MDFETLENDIENIMTKISECKACKEIDESILSSEEFKRELNETQNGSFEIADVKSMLQNFSQTILALERKETIIRNGIAKNNYTEPELNEERKLLSKVLYARVCFKLQYMKISLASMALEVVEHMKFESSFVAKK